MILTRIQQIYLGLPLPGPCRSVLYSLSRSKSWQIPKATWTQSFDCSITLTITHRKRTLNSQSLLQLIGLQMVNSRWRILPTDIAPISRMLYTELVSTWNKEAKSVSLEEPVLESQPLRLGFSVSLNFLKIQMVVSDIFRWITSISAILGFIVSGIRWRSSHRTPFSLQEQSNQISIHSTFILKKM